MPAQDDWIAEERVKWDAMTEDERFDMHMTVRADRAQNKLAADRLEHALERSSHVAVEAAAAWLERGAPTAAKWLREDYLPTLGDQ